MRQCVLVLAAGRNILRQNTQKKRDWKKKATRKTRDLLKIFRQNTRECKEFSTKRKRALTNIVGFSLSWGGPISRNVSGTRLSISVVAWLSRQNRKRGTPYRVSPEKVCELSRFSLCTLFFFSGDYFRGFWELFFCGQFHARALSGALFVDAPTFYNNTSFLVSSRKYSTCRKMPNRFPRTTMKVGNNVLEIIC